MLHFFALLLHVLQAPFSANQNRVIFPCILLEQLQHVGILENMRYQTTSETEAMLDLVKESPRVTADVTYRFQLFHEPNSGLVEKAVKPNQRKTVFSQ